MKKKSLICIATFVLSASVLTSCGDKKVASIGIGATPEKPSFLVGDKIDFTGFTAKVTYEDKSTEEITPDKLSFSCGTDYVFKEEDVPTKKVVISYKDKSFDYSIAVSKISKITVKNPDEKFKTTYNVGEKFSVDGLEAVAEIYDGTTYRYSTLVYGTNGYLTEPKVDYVFTQDDARAGSKEFKVIYHGITASDTTIKSLSVTDYDFSYETSSDGLKYANADNFKTIFESAKTDNTVLKIKLLHNVKVPALQEKAGQNIELDLNGKTLTITKPGEGSTGTQTAGLHLLKDSKLKIYSSAAEQGKVEADKDVITETNRPLKILVQHYNDLTLENVSLDGSNLSDSAEGDKIRLTLSNNFGNIYLKDNVKIISKKVNNGSSLTCYAFDFYYGMSDIYKDGISLYFQGSQSGSEIFDGKIQYSYNDTLSQDDWYRNIKVYIGGTPYIAHDKDLTSVKKSKDYKDWATFDQQALKNE